MFDLKYVINAQKLISTKVFLRLARSGRIHIILLDWFWWSNFRKSL